MVSASMLYKLTATFAPNEGKQGRKRLEWGFTHPVIFPFKLHLLEENHVETP